MDDPAQTYLARARTDGNDRLVAADGLGFG